jgi:hypothetical protein
MRPRQGKVSGEVRGIQFQAVPQFLDRVLRPPGQQEYLSEHGSQEHGQGIKAHGVPQLVDCFVMTPEGSKTSTLGPS